MKRLLKLRFIFLAVVLFLFFAGLLVYSPIFFFERDKSSSLFKLYIHGDTDSVSEVINAIGMEFVEKELYISSPTRIFVCTRRNEFDLFSFYFHRKAYAVTYLESNSIFLNFNRINEYGKRRTLKGVLLHELGHIWLKEHYGYLNSKITAKWKLEGICEFFAGESSFNIRQGLVYFLSQSACNAVSYKYFKYRLFVDYLIRHKLHSIDNIIQGKFNLIELESEIRQSLKDGSYICFGDNSNASFK